MNIRNSAYSALWSDLDHDLLYPNLRPILAHYTSIKTFESIISNDEFWFSNPITMNDFEELVFGMNQGAYQFRSHEALRDACNDDDTHSKLIHFFDTLFNSYDEKYALDTYVLCFSNHEGVGDDGSLSMWRGYGQDGNGIAIVIDTGKIEPLNGSPLIIAPVEYATKEQRIAWIDKKLNELAEYLRNDEQDDDSLQYYAYIWIKRLISFSLFTKHTGFSEEREWRIVYRRDVDVVNALEPMLSYHADESGLQPRLKLPLREIPESVGYPMELEDLIQKIILGPTTSTVIARKALERMVKQRGKTSLTEKIVYSSIPFRHYR